MLNAKDTNSLFTIYEYGGIVTIVKELVTEWKWFFDFPKVLPEDFLSTSIPTDRVTFIALQ